MIISEIFDIKYPFFQGGMAQVATGAFAASVSEAGAMGIIGSGAMDEHALTEEIKKAKDITDKPFGVNLMLMNPRADKMAEIIGDMGVSLVTTGAGNPGKYVKMWKDAGVRIFPVVSSVALAKRLESLGVDGLIAEGSESGGHIGELTTMVLLPLVAEAVNIPVVAAGGIATGKQVLAAEILGASGVQMGTLFLGSEECPIHENYKKSILNARDRSTIVTGRISGAPVRVLKNQMAQEYLRREQAGADMMELEKYTLGALRKAVKDGDVKHGSLMAGQSVAFVNEVKPVKEMLVSIMKEYEKAKEKI
ncbi:MAG: nitronate monooxygenase [Clostridiales bacterium]|nr:nitronate monooxygenase [Clostridiales bacterium]MDY4061095.1 nitronate monooxygenase [Anaerovoracaceae bacterium]